MSEYEYALIKRVYRLQSDEVDQYGKNNHQGETIIHGDYPTYEEAMKNLSVFAKKSDYTPRWFPKNASHDYWTTDVYCIQEVLARGSLAEVTIQAMGLRDK